MLVENLIIKTFLILVISKEKERIHEMETV